MPARRAAPDQKRQKLLLAVLSLVFVAVIGFWGARALTHKGGQTAAPPPTTSASTTGAATAAVAPVAPAQPSVFTVTQLSSFSGLSARDVFKSRVSTNVASSASTSPAATTAAASPPPQPAQTHPAQTVAIATPAAPANALGPLLPAALLKLNGTKQVVVVGDAFPTKNPVFRLTAVGRTAMWISLLHGTFAGGGSLLKIRHDHPTKLVSSGGTKLSFLIAILRVTARHVPPAPPATTTTAATTTTVAATTTPTTTTAVTTGGP